MLTNKTLPYKVALKVFSYLDVKSLCRVCLVCKGWKFLAEAESLWKDHVYVKWSVPPNQLIKNWKKTFQSKLVRYTLCVSNSMIGIVWTGRHQEYNGVVPV